MNCVVTAGPTYESLDQVRRLTNFSTGRLGSELANYLAAQGHQVTLLRGYYSVHVGELKAPRVVEFTTTADLSQRLQALAASPTDAIFHAAAVSDFGFGSVFHRLPSGELEPIESGKFSTRDGTLLVELVPTPKIIGQLRAWYPRALLFGWKYEVDGPRADALRAGAEQMARCATDACVVNGPAYGAGFGLLGKDRSCVDLPDARALFGALDDRLRGT